jgi:GAF domain-containing protein
MMPLLEVAAQEFYVAPEGSTAAPSRAVIQTMVSSRRALYVWDAQKDPRLTDSDSTHIRGLRSVMCVPFLINDQIRGALYVESVRQPYSFDRQDLELLAVFAHHVATALDNGRLYEVLDQAAERCLAEAQSARYDKAALTLAVRQSEKIPRPL